MKAIAMPKKKYEDVFFNKVLNRNRDGLVQRFHLEHIEGFRVRNKVKFVTP
jgi:hypothetical protein